MRLRPSYKSSWFNDKYTTYDIFAAESGGDGAIGSSSISHNNGQPKPDKYILSFLKPKIVDPPDKNDFSGFYFGVYDYVEAIDPVDSQIYRYTAEFIKPGKIFSGYADWVREVKLDRVPISHPQAQYGITWRDVTNPSDREMWISGSQVQVIDLSSGEVIAERTGYAMDFGQESKDGFRSPWSFADSCINYNPTRRKTKDFVEKVLRPM